MMIAPLPTNEADPRRRLASAHEAMRIAKERHDAVPANLIQDMTRYAPPAVAGLAARLVGAIPIDEMASPPFNLTISNVPGPRQPLYSAGSKLLHYYPVSTIAEGQGLKTTVNLVEELGADAYVYGTADVDGKPYDVIARVDGRKPPEKGQSVNFAPKQGHIHLFSTETGERLKA